MKRIRELIRSTRLQRQTALSELASLLDVPEAKLEEFESGVSSIEVETLFGLVNALNIEPEEFLGLLRQDEVDFSSDSATGLLSRSIRAKLKSKP